MSVRRLWLISVGSALALLAPIAAEGGQLLATIDRPAILTATPTKALESTAADRSGPRVVVDVTGYQPPQKGAVRGVIKVQKSDGTEHEIGTFGVFPNAAFRADSSRARRYSFPLPKELATGAVKLKVEVVPDKAQETGEGAQIEVGGAEIH
jgi:hypothetical protein